MTERQRIYQEECVIDQLMDWLEEEEQFQPVMFNDLLPAARTILDAEERGPQVSYAMLVVLYESDLGFPIDEGRWRYLAVSAAHANGMTGCPHDVDAASFRYAQVTAISEHRHVCLQGDK